MNGAIWYFIGMFVGTLLTLNNAWNNISEDHLLEVATKCTHNGGVKSVTINIIHGTKVYCKDGATFHVRKLNNARA